MINPYVSIFSEEIVPDEGLTQEIESFIKDKFPNLEKSKVLSYKDENKLGTDISFNTKGLTKIEVKDLAKQIEDSFGLKLSSIHIGLYRTLISLKENKESNLKDKKGN